jgi:aryl-alcohol dehydrogenase-like predicted oxidoreductase
MHHRQLGSTGIATIPFALGGNVFGWTSRAPEAYRLLDRFVEQGGSLIDTADVYSAWVKGHSGGESEQLIGDWLKQRGRRDDVVIITKVGLMPGEGGKGLEPARIRAAVEASLRRLQTDRIDVYFAHKDDPDTPLEESLAAFDELVRAGKVRALGASQYTAQRLGAALDAARDGGFEPFRVIQPELSLVRQDVYAGALQKLALAHDLGVITYFSLAAGFLSGKYRSEADLAGRERRFRVKDYLNAQGLGVLGVMDVIAAESGHTLPQIALAWIMAQPGVTAPISSATSQEQLDELMQAVRITLSPAELAELDRAALDAGAPAA